MASASVETAGGPTAGTLLIACVAGQGSGAHPYSASEELARGPDGARNLADLIHFLCILHGRYPGVVDHAAGRVTDAAERAWLAAAAAAFAAERTYLSRLAVAAGPVPSTPGAADSDSAVIGQRHALEMLAASERSGCALGAAMAVILDWAAVRNGLDAAARRFGLEAPAYEAADAEAIAALADRAGALPAARRALLFGAQQILIQHHGLFELLDTRRQARAGS